MVRFLQQLVLQGADRSRNAETPMRRPRKLWSREGVPMPARQQPSIGGSHCRSSSKPAPPVLLAAVEDVEIDTTLYAMRKTGTGILPEHPVAAGIHLRRMGSHRAKPERIVLDDRKRTRLNNSHVNMSDAVH